MLNKYSEIIIDENSIIAKLSNGQNLYCLCKSGIESSQSVVFEGIDKNFMHYPSKDIYVYYCPKCKVLKRIDSSRKNICDACKSILNEKALNKYQSNIMKCKRLFLTKPIIQNKECLIRVYIIQDDEFNNVGEIKCHSVPLSKKTLVKSFFKTDIADSVGKYVIDYLLNSDEPCKNPEYKKAILEAFKKIYPDVFEKVDENVLLMSINIKEILLHLQCAHTVKINNKIKNTSYERTVMDKLNNVEDALDIANKLYKIGIGEDVLDDVCTLFNNVNKYTSYNIKACDILIKDLLMFNKTNIASLSEIIGKTNHYINQQQETDDNAGITVLLYMEQYIKLTKDIQDGEVIKKIRNIFDSNIFKEFVKGVNDAKNIMQQYKIKHIAKLYSNMYKNTIKSFAYSDPNFSFELFNIDETISQNMINDNSVYNTILLNADELISRKIVLILINQCFIAIYDSINDKYSSIFLINNKNTEVKDIALNRSLDKYRLYYLKTALLLTSIYQSF